MTNIQLFCNHQYYQTVGGKKSLSRVLRLRITTNPANDVNLRFKNRTKYKIVSVVKINTYNILISVTVYILFLFQYENKQ